MRGGAYANISFVSLLQYVFVQLPIRHREFISKMFYGTSS